MTMRNNGKIIKMNPGYFERSSGMFLIHRKNNPYQNPDNENDITKNQLLMRTNPMRTKRN